ncbi:MAG: hypothetical protein ACREAB_18710 [Blastocatellia bacterium]
MTAASSSSTATTVVIRFFFLFFFIAIIHEFTSSYVAICNKSEAPPDSGVELKVIGNIVTRAARKGAVDSAQANDGVAEIKPHHCVTRWIEFQPPSEIEREVRRIERTPADESRRRDSLIEVNESGPDLEKDSRILNSGGHLHAEQRLGSAASFKPVFREEIDFAFGKFHKTQKIDNSYRQPGLD